MRTGVPSASLFVARLSAGAGFVVLLCGDIMTLPGLSANPAAHKIGLGKDGEIVGLF